MSKVKFVSSIKTSITGTARLLTTREGLKSLYGVSLYRNALYLMINSGIFALTGFFFWIVAAKVYSAEAVGLSSAAISVMGLLSILSSLGLDYGLIRFLGDSGDKAKDMIISCLTIGGLVSIGISVIFVAGLGVWSSALLPIRNDPLFFAGFVVFAMVTTLLTFTGQSFIAARKTGYSLAQGLVGSLLRFVPLVLLAGFSRDFGIFGSWGLAGVAALVVSMLFFLPRVYQGIRPFPSIRKDVVGEMLRFSIANYAANIFLALPQLILPLMVVNILGGERNGYYYIGWGVAGIVFMIPQAATLSLLAEASFDTKKVHQQLKGSFKMILLILIPAIVIILLLGNKILLLFGRDYSENSTVLLRYLACSSLPMSINYVYFTMRRIEKNMKSVIWLNALIAATTLGLAYFLLRAEDIAGAGLALLISQSAAALFTVPYLWGRFFRPESILS